MRDTSVFHAVALLHHLLIPFYTLRREFSEGLAPEHKEMVELSSRYFTNWSLVSLAQILFTGRFFYISGVMFMFIWSEAFQTLYLIIALCDDLLSRSAKRQSWLSPVKDYLFFSLVIPCSSFTTISFWSLYNIKKEFVLPEGSEIVLPYWLNHMVHTNTMITVVMEFMLNRHKLPSKRSAFLGLAVVLTLYDYIFVYTFFEKGKWLYGVYEEFNFIGSLMFLAGSTANIFLFMFAGFYLQEYKTMTVGK